jgi:hypothetical protein
VQVSAVTLKIAAVLAQHCERNTVGIYSHREVRLDQFDDGKELREPQPVFTARAVLQNALSDQRVESVLQQTVPRAGIHRIVTRVAVATTGNSISSAERLPSWIVGLPLRWSFSQKNRAGEETMPQGAGAQKS